MNSSRSLLFVAALFAVYLIIKWTSRLLFGLIDYAFMILFLIAIVYYLKLPLVRRKQLHLKLKNSVTAIAKTLGMD